MPMLIEDRKSHEDFQRLDMTDSNSALYHELMGIRYVEDISSHLTVPVPPGYRILRIDTRYDNGFEVALVSDATKSVIYYNKVNEMQDVALTKNLEDKRVTQVLLWRSSDYAYKSVLRDVPESVFFDYLLKNYLIVVSDSQQTTDGSRFWGSCITRALATNLYVYHYSLMRGHVERIETKQDLDARRALIWGSEEGVHEHELAVISSVELPKKG